MSKNHTPGPWRVEIGVLCPSNNIPNNPKNSKASDIRVYAPPEDESKWVADCGHFYSEEAKANARLIAAAPELLQSLQGLCGLAKLRPGKLYEYVAAVADAEAAISKATGQQS